MPGRKGYKLASDLRQMGADPTVILWTDPWGRSATPQLLVALAAVEAGLPDEECVHFIRHPAEPVEG